MKLKLFILLISLFGFTIPNISAQGTKPQCKVLIIGGKPGSPVFARRYQDWIKRFQQYFVKQAKVPAKKITVLSGDTKFKPGFPVKHASLPAIQQELANCAKTVKPDDQFVLIIIGHGATTDNVTKLALKDRDLTTGMLTEAIDQIKAKQQIILYMAGGGGNAIADLSSSNRVIISASSPNQIVEPVFAEFFLRGMESKRADGEGAPKAGKKDNVVTLLEAFNWASNQTAHWIRRIRSLGEEKWQIDGKESIEIFKKLYVSNNKEPGSKVLAKSNADVKDPMFPLTSVGVDRQKILGLRIITENAMLEDAGEQEGLTAVRTGKYLPLEGTKNGEPGTLARKTVLGKPGLIK